MSTTVGTGRAASCSPVAWLAIGLLLAAQSVSAGVQISPTRVDLDAERRVAALTLHNTTSRDVSFQVELAAWDQVDGSDQYQPTSDLLATPPVFTVPAGEQQMIRVGLRRQPDSQDELQYRLFIQELPPPTPDDFTGLQMVLRMGLPVFLAPATGPAEHDLSWRAVVDASGQVQLEISNHGNGHAQIDSLSLNIGGDTVENAGMFYVLPGSTRQRILPTSNALAPGAEVELSARVNRQQLTRRVRVE